MSNIGRIASKGSGAYLNSKQYAAFTADRKRLEWMIANSAFISHSSDGEMCNVWFSHDPEDDGGGPVPVEGYPQKCYHDPREAIDAVMPTPNQRGKG